MPIWDFTDYLDTLAHSEAFSHALHNSIQDAQVLGLPVQTWASDESLKCLLSMYIAETPVLSVAMILVW